MHGMYPPDDNISLNDYDISVIKLSNQKNKKSQQKIREPMPRWKTPFRIRGDMIYEKLH